MDLSPYQFKAPFEAYEFGHFAAEAKPDLVIVLMNWIDSHPELDAESIEMSIVCKEQTIRYWAERLRPCHQQTMDVVICNRVGLEKGGYLA